MAATAGKPPGLNIIPDKADLEKTNSICKRFILASFIFFLINITMGYLMLSRVIPSAPVFVHAHTGLYGWVTMLIFGVAYKLLPTAFANKNRVYSLRLAEVHFWMSIVGMSGLLLCGYISQFSASSILFHMKEAFGAVLLASGFIFVINMWKTFGKPRG